MFNTFFQLNFQFGLNMKVVKIKIAAYKDSVLI